MIKAIDYLEVKDIYDRFDKSIDTLPPSLKGRYWGYYVNNEIVGTIGIIDNKSYSKPVNHFVKKEYRNKGIGKELLLYALNNAYNKRIVSYVTKMSLNFYLKLGYTITKTYKRTFKVENIGGY